MSLLGGVIKKSIDLNGFISSEPGSYKAQKKVLMQMLKRRGLQLLVCIMVLERSWRVVVEEQLSVQKMNMAIEKLEHH